MPDDNTILETESKSLMGVPGSVSLQQAAARSVCTYRYDGYNCCSPRYFLHARVVGLAMLDYFMLCVWSVAGAPPIIHLSAITV